MENIETSLEALLNEFNTDIRKNCDSGKSKQELEERYRSMMKCLRILKEKTLL